MLLGVDVGGTFTDAVLADGARVHSTKVPSTPDAPQRGVLEAIAGVLARAGVQAAQVQRFAHGMTVATNALLEGRGARTALIATEGFEDIVALGRQARPSLYRLCQAAPAPLAPPELRFGAPERMGPQGTLRALDPAAALALVERLAHAEPEAVAVALLHSYAHPAHELALGQLIAARLPRARVSLSHDLVGTFREYERAASTEVDAALSPLLADYLGELGRRAVAVGLPPPEVMQSSGGLTDASVAAAHAALTVLSGPAGGVRAALLLSSLAGEQDVLCFDMGGTSCDVCLIRAGEVAETAGRVVAGRPLALPALDIHTVGAGGGSIAWRDAGGALRVGPRSAGALPGPACYGRGGREPTVTDANLLLGRLQEDVPLAGGLRLNREAAARALGALATGLGLGLTECAEGVVRVAEAEMLRALRVMTVERGIDPRPFALLAFGGAGPLHAASMARELGIERVLVPQPSGVLSALGLALAPPRRDVARTVMLAGAELCAARLAAERDSLIARACEQLPGRPGAERPGAERPGKAAQIRVRYELRYAGQAFELGVEERESVDPELIGEAFARAHEARYGYRQEGTAIELVTIRVSACLPAPRPQLTPGVLEVPESRLRPAIFDGSLLEAECLHGALPAGARVHGPGICALAQTTVVVPPGWAAEADQHGTLRMSAAGASGRVPARRAGTGGPPLDAIALQVLSGALRASCEEMGAALIRAAQSANIKERRDASTALFDADGQMVMQAEHIPVHLGAMPDAVAAVLHERHRPGRSWILNDPFAGGTHLPDITLVTPAFERRRLLGFAASRAHHADVGGRWPGSMPADSRSLAEEGVVIAPQPLTDAALSALTKRMRQPAERRADLRAQLAANEIGAARLAELARRVGPARLRAATDAVMDYCERRTRTCLAELRERCGPLRSAEDVLEAGEHDLVLRLRATLLAERLILDFAGSAPQHRGNLNCPPAVTRSACYFAVRTLTDPDIPPCAGAYRPVEVLAPAGSLLNARPGAAVAAGNVETSSRVADLVLAAFGCALGQGTMNNLTLGNRRFTYYETLGGGQGACADADGPSGVHVAMSNTLNTPVEALERELPLRVARYAMRRGSGGHGRTRGGDGVVRELEALEDMEYSLITERRRHAPPGADGGEPGARGRNILLGRDGAARELAAKLTGRLAAGERLRIETPGGGGFGAPATTPADPSGAPDTPS